MELRSVVDFLNKQMDRSEVLLVEARQYREGNQRIVVPTLFGYTEEARMVKRTVTVHTPGQRGRWDEKSFFADASQRLEESQVKALRKLYEFSQREAQKIAWGTGAVRGSFTPLWSAFDGNGLFNAFSDGRLWITFGGLNDRPVLQDKLKSALEKVLEVEFSDDFRVSWPSVAIDVWAPRVSGLIDVINQLTS